MPLLNLPEEILFFILEFTILPLEPKLSLPEPKSLLTCSSIHRVGFPILHQSILRRFNPQALKVKSTILSLVLREPRLVCHIRYLYSSAVLVSWLPVFKLTLTRAASSAFAYYIQGCGYLVQVRQEQERA